MTSLYCGSLSGSDLAANLSAVNICIAAGMESNRLADSFGRICLAGLRLGFIVHALACHYCRRSFQACIDAIRFFVQCIGKDVLCKRFQTLVLSNVSVSSMYWLQSEFLL